MFTLFFKGGIYVYKATLAPFLGGRCRFVPSCSDYALEALDKHPPLKAISLITKRLSKCHPFGSHGIDLVPEHKESCQCH